MQRVFGFGSPKNGLCLNLIFNFFTSGPHWNKKSLSDIWTRALRSLIPSGNFHRALQLLWFLLETTRRFCNPENRHTLNISRFRFSCFSLSCRCRISDISKLFCTVLVRFPVVELAVARHLVCFRVSDRFAPFFQVQSEIRLCIFLFVPFWRLLGLFCLRRWVLDRFRIRHVARVLPETLPTQYCCICNANAGDC